MSPRRYEGDGIVVEFEPSRCIHAARCVNGLPAVFDAEARPWIQPEKGEADAIAATVRQCPTGALKYERQDGGPEEVAPDKNSAHVVPDGPLYVAGRIRLVLPDGSEVEETRIALCRCGDSKNKPFCDNTHLEMKFTDPGTAAEHRLKPSESAVDGSLTVRLAANGPILIEGPVEVVSTGDSATGGKGALCRCGASGAKPYCDGSHSGAGFVAD